ncbi:hypothetical protein J6590_003860 [Homalodisca vitripennis]|nr:hypothetical protein J6590_003860 [Homalodisca vitripennis]
MIPNHQLVLAKLGLLVVENHPMTICIIERSRYFKAINQTSLDAKTLLGIQSKRCHCTGCKSRALRLQDLQYLVKGDFRTTTNGRAGGLLGRTGSLSGHPSKQQPRSMLLDQEKPTCHLHLANPINIQEWHTTKHKCRDRPLALHKTTNPNSLKLIKREFGRMQIRRTDVIGSLFRRSKPENSQKPLYIQRCISVLRYDQAFTLHLRGTVQQVLYKEISFTSFNKTSPCHYVPQQSGKIAISILGHWQVMVIQTASVLRTLMKSTSAHALWGHQAVVTSPPRDLVQSERTIRMSVISIREPIGCRDNMVLMVARYRQRADLTIAPGLHPLGSPVLSLIG